MRFAYLAFASVAAPYAIAIDLSASDRIGNGYENFSANFAFPAGVAVGMPTIAIHAFSNSWLRSRKPHPSAVQPGVSAFGKNHWATRFPRNAASVRSLPV